MLPTLFLFAPLPLFFHWVNSFEENWKQVFCKVSVIIYWQEMKGWWQIMLIPRLYYLKENEQLLIDAFSRRWTVNGPGQVYAKPFWRVERRRGLTLGPTDYIRVRNTVTGELHNELGPKLYFLTSAGLTCRISPCIIWATFCSNVRCFSIDSAFWSILSEAAADNAPAPSSEKDISFIRDLE